MQALVDLDFDVELTGFSLAEVDLIVDEAKESSRSGHPALSEAAVTRPGDVWHLGRHRLVCGDSRIVDTLKVLMGTDRANLIFTDPPYNVPIKGHVSGLGRTQHRDFAMAVGEMSSAGFTGFLTETLGHAASVAEDGSIAGPHTNTFGLGDTGRYRTNVWDYAGVNTMKAGRMDELTMHPTVKPVALVADAIKDCSKRGDIVLDPFAGSGTGLATAVWLSAGCHLPFPCSEAPHGHDHDVDED